MTTREQLQERYEDALFARLMYDIGIAQEKEAEEENERLNNAPDFVIPEDVDGRCLQVIHRHRARQRACAAGKFTLKAVKRAAIAAGIAVLLFVGAFAASETVRVNTVNLIRSIYKTHLELAFPHDEPPASPELSIGWVPEGYSLFEQKSNFASTWYGFHGPTTETLWADCTRTSGLSASIDTENATVETIEIQGEPAMLIDKQVDAGTDYQIVWTARDYTLLITVSGEDISRDDIIRVAEELKY